MEVNELQALLAANDIKATVEKVKAALPFDFTEEERLKEYEPEGHAVFDHTKRQDKPRMVPTGVLDDRGQPVMTKGTHKVNRIGFAGQKLIVSRRSMFVTGAGIGVDSKPNGDSETRLLDMVTKTMEDTKLSYKWGPVFQDTEAQGECAVLFYFTDTEPEYWGKLGSASTVKKLKMSILLTSDGDEFYPVFDMYKDLVAFGRSYKVAKKEWFDLYTATEIYQFREVEGGWTEEIPKAGRKHGFDRIPIGYFTSYEKMWKDQQSVIDRLEFLFSVHGDINDYNGSPLLVGTGEVQSMPNAGEPGKFFVLEGQGADLKYVTWNSAPESIKMEIENLLKNLYTTSRTPNTSFEEVKGIGAISAAALRLLFLDAHAAAKDHQDGTYGETVQRVFNIIKHAMGSVDITLKAAVQSLVVKPKFTAYIPKNEAEELANEGQRIRNLAEAVMSNLMTIETAIKSMPSHLIADPEQELLKIMKQLKEKEERRVEEQVILEI